VQTIIAKGGGGGTSRLRSAAAAVAAAVAVAVAVAVAASRVPQFSQLIRFKQTILCIQYVFYQRNHAAPVLSTATATPSAAINNFVS
jgi:hypothetical protein